MSSTRGVGNIWCSLYVLENIPLTKRRHSSSRRVCRVLILVGYGWGRIRSIALGMRSSSSSSLPDCQNLRQWGPCATLGLHIPRVRGQVMRTISLRYGCFPHLPALKDIVFVMDHRCVAYYHTHEFGRCNSLSTVLSLIVIAGKSGGIRLKNTISSSVLSQFIHIRLLSYHVTVSVAVCWIWLSTADAAMMRNILPTQCCHQHIYVVVI